MKGRYVSFKVTEAEKYAINCIIDRVMPMAAAAERRELAMDLCACHANGNPMDFERLAEADEFNLMHDVYGIQRYLDRDTGRLTNCFSPRFSKHGVVDIIS